MLPPPLLRQLESLSAEGVTVRYQRRRGGRGSPPHWGGREGIFEF